MKSLGAAFVFAMGLAFVVALEIAAVLLVTIPGCAHAQQVPQHRRFLQPSMPRTPAASSSSGPAAPAFAFATSSGTGMSAACAGATITGTGGETITFTRSGTRTCLKGGETSGIANGDLVSIPNGKPAVQYGNTGSGVLGLNVWEARANTIVDPGNLSTGNWVPFGYSHPTVTANYAAAPDGTTTATRLQLASTDATQLSIVYQDGTAGACAVGDNALSCFVRCTSAANCITDIGLDDSSGWKSAPCAGTNASWSRCYVEHIPNISSGGSVLVAIGNQGGVNSGITRVAADVLFGGCQCELGGTMSPYMPGGSRGKEVATVSYTASGGTVSLGGTLAPATLVSGGKPVASMVFDSTNETALSTLGAKNLCNLRIGGTATLLEAVGNLLTPATAASACAYSTTQIACDATSCKPVTGALTLPTGVATLYLGGLQDGGTVNDTISSICADPSATRCQPAGAASTNCPFSGTAAQTVALIGDSIMVGADTQKMAEEMGDRLCSRSIGVVQYAVSGSTISDCADQYHTSVKGHPYRDVATECGTNTLLSGSSAATAWAQMESLMQDVTSDGGFHVVLGNVTPCTGYSGCDAAKVTAFNAMEANWCADAGSRATCIDNYTLLLTGMSTINYSAPQTIMGNLCQPTDSLHPNSYCTTRLADSFADAVP